METTQLWTYVALNDYAVPSAPVTEVAQKGLRRLRRQLWPKRGRDAMASREVTQKASQEFFRELFTEPEWMAAATALAGTVETRRKAGATQQVLVGGPHRCTADMLRHLARDKQWPLLEGPEPDDVLQGRFEPPKSMASSPVVIPQLADWFLRHDAGLEVIRRLMDWLLSSGQSAVLGCHSWAWSYLERAVQIGGALAGPQVLAPFNAIKLTHWLQELAGDQGGSSTVFREASTGRVVLGLTPSGGSDAPAGSPSNLLTHIASQGRGLPEITWSLWRESILRFKQEMVTAEAMKAANDDSERTIWVPSWAQLNLPELPGKPGHLPLFLLHCLLLHAGLPAHVLPKLLPFSREEIHRGLRDLQSRGVVEIVDGSWQVTAAGYPAVRRILDDEGYLVDPL